MKKFLLTLAAVSLAAGAWAEGKTPATSTEDLKAAGYVDVTPTYYNFYKGNTDKEKLVRTDLQSPAAPNLGDYFIINEPESEDVAGTLNTDHFSVEQIAAGNLVISGGYNKKEAALAEGISLLKLNDKIGEVFVLNGKDSKLEEAVKEKFNIDKEIGKVKDAFVNIQFFWIFDHIKLNSQFVNDGEEAEDLVVRIRFEYNVFQNKDGAVEGKNEATKQININSNTSTDLSKTPQDPFLISDFVDAEGNWDPTQWMVYEFEYDHTRNGAYIKQFINGATSGLDTGALLIRNIEILVINKKAVNEYKLESGEINKSWNTYSLEASTPTDPPTEEEKPDQTERTKYEGKDADIENGFTITYDHDIKKAEDKGEITVAVKSKSGDAVLPKVVEKVEGKVHTITLESDNEELKGVYVVTIPEGYLTCGDEHYSAAVVKEINYTPTGISGLESENAPVEYYNLQGVKVANPEKGIYIRVQGKKVSKVVR